MAAKRASTHFVDCDEPKKICLETQNELDCDGAHRTSGQVAKHDILLTTLNDDCIVEIFGYLNITELLAVSIVCRRFHAIGLHFLKNKLRCLDLSKGNDLGKDFCKPYNVGLILALLRIYGKYVIELTFHPADFAKITSKQAFAGADRLKLPKTTRILDTIGTYCTSLTTLTLRSVEFNSYTFQRKIVRKLFRRLSKLTLENCAYPRFESFRNETKKCFKKCHKLVSMSLLSKHDDICDQFSIKSIKNLKELEVKMMTCSRKRNHFYYLPFTDKFPKFIKALGARDKIQKLWIFGSRSNDEQLLKSIICCKRLKVFHIEPDWDWDFE